MKRHHFNRQAAFTLIELLVVVSIIALLISILLPAVGNAKKTASATVCGTRLRGLGTSLFTYLGEWEGKLPYNGVIFPKPGGNSVSPTTGYGYGEIDPQKWDLPYGILWRNMGESRKGYFCPDDDFQRGQKGQLVRNDNGVIGTFGETAGASPMPPDGKGYWSYSVNSVLNSEGQFRFNFFPRGGTGKVQQPWADPIRLQDPNQVLRPSDFIIIVEEDPLSRFNDEVFDAPAYNGGDRIASRHNGGGNVLFADNHAEYFNATLFNKVPGAQPSPSDPNPVVSHTNAMISPYTRMFFPDGGQFAN